MGNKKIWLRVHNENLANSPEHVLHCGNTSQGIRYYHIYETMKSLGIDVVRQDPQEPCVEVWHGWTVRPTPKDGNKSVYTCLGSDLMHHYDIFCNVDLHLVASDSYLRQINRRDIPIGVWCCACIEPDIFYIYDRKPTPFVFLHSVFPAFLKGTDLVGEAFERAFLNRNDVELQIHCSRTGGDSWKLSYFSDRFIGSFPTAYEVPNIKFVYQEETYKTRDQAAQLYNGHCYVYPSLADTWCTTPMEAGCTGIPTILSSIKLFKEIYPEEIALFLPMYFNRRHYGQGSPSVEDITKQMIYCYEHQDEISKRGLMAAEYIRDNYSWKKRMNEEFIPIMEHYGYL